MINLLPKAKLAKPQKKNTEILDYRHKGAKRKNNPEEGLAIYLPEEKGSQKYSYDPHLDPQLIWSGKAERASFEVPVVPLHIHERVSPRNIVGVLEKKRGHQLRLFDEAEFPLDKRVDFYKHDMDWANRLILGDSLLVMNSLLTKELMSSKVQMIYIDPPYGVKFGSNFQPELKSHEVGENDIDLTREPEQIKAYRDTWELGVHSYLSYLCDRLQLAKELLSESGSVFVQISDENVHRVRVIMDEILGAQNFVSLIPFRKKLMPLGAKTLENMCDYLIWYSKDKDSMKYRQLYYKSEPKASSRWTGVELADGTRRRLTREESESLSLLPKGSKVYRLVSQTAPSYSEHSVYEFIFKGRKFMPKAGQCWVTTKERMEELARKNRLEIEGESLSYVMYHDDFPYSKLTNPWTDTVGAFDKVYVVQTNDLVIERCILMTTDTGDMVFDPTCGSGTTAFVAEKWGRRWLSCDTSRIALSLARQRLITGIFPYFKLAHPEDGVRGGFECKKVEHQTMRTIAQDELPEIETLSDKPIVDTSAIRVSGPFTVEAIPAPSVEPIQDNVSARDINAENYVSTLVEAIRKSGVIFPKGKILRLTGVVPISSAGFLHAEGEASNGETRQVAISFGPRYGPLSARQAEEAIRSATVGGYSLLILSGFQIDPAAEAFVQRTPVKLDVQFAYINPDMQIHDLLKQTQGSQLFSVFGEPDIELKKTGKGEAFTVKLLGVDVYNPITGSTEQTSGDAIPAWFLDEDYDGYSFNICQAFFPDGATGKNPWDKLENALHGIVDKDKLEQLKSNESLPFELGEHKTIAVKVIDNRGNEVIKIRKLHGPEKV